MFAKRALDKKSETKKNGLRSYLTSHVSDVAAIVHPRMCDMGDIYLVNVRRQGIRCLLVVKNGVGVAT